MKDITNIEFRSGSKEERLPGFAPDFPYIASRAELDKYIGRFVPWHWHKTVELFYVESGVLEYNTPKGKTVFPAGSGGMVNSNVLHMTRAGSEGERNVQLIHIFDPSFIAGEPGKQDREEICPSCCGGLPVGDHGILSRRPGAGRGSRAASPLVFPLGTGVGL